MAEDHNRPHRSSESIARTGHARSNTSGSTNGSDPLAELARLIGQTDPFGDAMHASARLAESAGAPPAVDWTAPSTHAQRQQAFAPNEFSFPPVTPDHHAPTHAAPAVQPAPQAYNPTSANELYRIEPEVPSYLTARGPDAQPVQSVYGEPPQYAAEQHDAYDDLPPPRRRIGTAAAAVVFGLAVVGTAGAFGYRSLFGHAGTRVPPVIAADKTPLKIVPNNAGAESKKVADRVTGPTEKVVPREEKPVDLAQKIVATPTQDVQPPVASIGNGVLSSEPKKVHTIVIRPDGSSEAQQAMASPMPPQTAVPPAPPVAAPNSAPRPAATPVAAPPVAASAPPAPPLAPARPAIAHHDTPAKPAPRAQASNAPLSLAPDAGAARTPVRTASAGPAAIAATPAAAHRTGAYAVQVSSQKSEAEAKAAFRSLQTKYAKELGSQPMFVHKVDLGAKGVYYRTMIGPFASGSQATELCSALKSAGGSCIIQRN